MMIIYSRAVTSTRERIWIFINIYFTRFLSLLIWKLCYLDGSAFAIVDEFSLSLTRELWIFSGIGSGMRKMLFVSFKFLSSK